MLDDRTAVTSANTSYLASVTVPPKPPGAPPATAPATGSSDPAETELAPGEEPTTTGTLFLMLLFLMLIAGFWGMMYVTLLHR